MTLPSWHEEPIAKRHDRASFDCGDAPMNDFLRRFARQSHDQNAAKPFCAIDDTDLGSSIGFELPHYPQLLMTPCPKP